jgi:hypothetical protein
MKMYTSLIIHKDKKTEIKTNHFKIMINLFLGSSKHKELLIDAKNSIDVLTIVNNLNKISKWLLKSEIDEHGRECPVELK